MRPLNIAASEKDFVMLIILSHAWKHARHAARWASRRFSVLASAAGLLSATIPRPRSYFMCISLFRPPRLLLAPLGCTRVCGRVAGAIPVFPFSRLHDDAENQVNCCTSIGLLCLTVSSLPFTCLCGHTGWTRGRPGDRCSSAPWPFSSRCSFSESPFFKFAFVWCFISFH